MKGGKKGIEPENKAALRLQQALNARFGQTPPPSAEDPSPIEKQEIPLKTSKKLKSKKK